MRMEKIFSNRILATANGILLFCLLSFLPSNLLAQGEVPAEPQQPALRFGYLSYDSALIAMPDYITVQDSLAALRAAYEKELRRVEDEFNQKYEAFLDQQKDFPRTILLKRQTELQELLQRNVDFKNQGLKDLAQAEHEAMAPLRARLDQAIADLATQLSLPVVLNTDAHATLFIDPQLGINLNEQILQYLK